MSLWQLHCQPLRQRDNPKCPTHFVGVAMRHQGTCNLYNFTYRGSMYRSQWRSTFPIASFCRFRQLIVRTVLS